MKRTQKEVEGYFESQGCKLLDEYTGCMKPMKYQCKCEREDYKSWNKFKDRGHRCGYCHETGRKKKLTFEEAKKEFDDRGFELIETEYKNVSYPMSYRCKCGNISRICITSLRNNASCYECGLNKNKKENHHMWIEDRSQKAEYDLIKKKCYKALRKSLKAVCRYKTSRTEYMLGYSPKQLQEHLKSHPNWQSVKNGKWHLDHIFPINAFKEHGIDDLKIINCLENLQPMEGRANISKGRKYNEKEFLDWLNKKQ